MQQAVRSARMPSPYAVGRDFCRIFVEEMDELYVLSLLLTANPEKAQGCFVAALEDCSKATAVFKNWARPWARRTVVQNAIAAMQPQRPEAPVSAFRQVQDSAPTLPDNATPLPALLSLDTFERFVFVLSVLERYSDHECRALLNCSRIDVIEARTRAFVQIGRWRSTVPQAIATGPDEVFAQAS